MHFRFVLVFTSVLPVQTKSNMEAFFRAECAVIFNPVVLIDSLRQHGLIFLEQELPLVDRVAQNRKSGDQSEDGSDEGLVLFGAPGEHEAERLGERVDDDRFLGNFATTRLA